MSRNYFRVFGAMMLLMNPVVLIPTFFPINSLTPGKLTLLAAIELVGFGLAFLRKWAALYFSVPLFCFGILLVFDAIYNVAFPLNLLVMIFGFSFTSPLVLTIRLWKQLTWGRRFF